MARPVFQNGDDWDLILKQLLPATKMRRAGALDTTDAYAGTADAEVPSAGFVLAVTAGQHLSLADSDVGSVCGVSLHQTDQHAHCDYVARGYVFADTWLISTGAVRLVPGKTYFLLGKGRLSLTPPSSGYIIPIGQSQSEYLMDVCIGTKVKL